MVQNLLANFCWSRPGRWDSSRSVAGLPASPVGHQGVKSFWWERKWFHSPDRPNLDFALVLSRKKPIRTRQSGIQFFMNLLIDFVLESKLKVGTPPWSPFPAAGVTNRFQEASWYRFKPMSWPGRRQQNFGGRFCGPHPVYKIGDFKTLITFDELKEEGNSRWDLKIHNFLYRSMYSPLGLDKVTRTCVST